MNTTATTIDDYLSGQPSETRQKLTELRALVNSLIPNCKEAMSYGIPTFKYKGKNVFHFAGYKSHIGLYPGSAAIVEFRQQLGDYKTAKGTVQIPLDEPLPTQLIVAMVRSNLSRLQDKS